MEIVIVGDKNTKWYKKCRNYLDEKKIQFDKLYKLCEKYGISKENVATDYDTLYLTYEKPYSDEVIKMLKSARIYTKKGTYCIVKKNSKLGREFLNLKISKPNSPKVGNDLLSRLNCGIRYNQFIHNEKVYMRIESNTEIKIPDGFETIKLSDYFNMLEKIKDKSNNLFLENI